MIAYLDSNIFDFISKRGDTDAAKNIFNHKRVSILVSEYHFIEAVSIPNSSIRQAQLAAITKLANNYSPTPLPRLHAQELRYAIAVCRPNWTNNFPKDKHLDKLLRKHKKKYQAVKEGKLLTIDSSQYRRDSERGIKAAREFQKFVRTGQVTAKKTNPIKNQWQEGGQTVDFNLADPESYWRAEAAMAWHQAIVERCPASRDYADYLVPYIRDNAFRDGTYAAFWRDDVVGDKLPLNRLTGLASFFQLRAKIGHGNAYDILHANFGNKCDVFLTADKAFFGVLSELRQYLEIKFAKPKFAKPIYIDRNNSDGLGELKRKLEFGT